MQLRESTAKILKECIDNEDKKKPLTDDELTELLAEEGIFLARRTVAKYRIELGIGSSTARRARNRGK